MDKTLLKVSGIISIVVGVLCCFTIIGAIIGIPLIIGGLKFKGYADLPDSEIIKKKEAIIIWSVVFMFINQLSGILAIIFLVQMEEANKPKNNARPTMSEDKYAQLERVKKLYDDKVLTQEEFEKEKNRILNS